ncbi:RNA polymerase II transcription elongation factor-domain-containing protein [Scheffersomyces xylosifermentans]|uniref:RNA polymerase II transcription elongation factor-domain-containing protein n=1 Tax=Scheffersomyces xylosifermentans TaxID=1304137 RepID=UPI00315D22FF
MSLADGEYEIDLSALLDIPPISGVNEDDNIAVRYGFIPDSMDQSKPLMLYQNDKDCLLKASTTDGTDQPIIFEGIPQQHRSNSANVANDSFYLSYLPNASPNGPKTVELKRLTSTIRFNKSRNVAKLQQKIAKWDAEYANRKNQQSQNSTNPKKSPTKRTTPPSVTKPSPTKHSTPTSIKTPPQASRPRAAKRPPTANNTPDTKQAVDSIISESDFEDLDNDDFDFGPGSKSSDFPIIVLGDDNDVTKEARPPKAEVEKKLPLPQKPSKPANIIEEAPKKKERAPSKPSVKKNSKPKAPIVQKPDDSIDLDDDFKDLEDQLQEVLEEEEQGSKSPSAEIRIENILPNDSINDSDESDADDYQFPGIKIDEGNSTPSSKYKDNFSTTPKPNQKPMSLRDLVGGGKKSSQDEDLSSSEEE